METKVFDCDGDWEKAKISARKFAKDNEKVGIASFIDLYSIFPKVKVAYQKLESRRFPVKAS